MKFRKLLTSSFIVALASSTALAQTGRQIQTTTPAIDNGDGTSTDTFVDTFWDSRCAGNVDITYNSDFLPNDTNGGPVITEAETIAAIDAGLQRWTDNRSSFIDMEVANSASIPGVLTGAPLFNFVNEASFELAFTAIGFPPGILAFSTSTPLMADATFSVGDDIDLDGDSDVFDPDIEGSNTCHDADGDGDIEFPAGDYLAGTILDNGVFFNSEVVWETGAASAAADIDAVSTHEYGHSLGLTHSTINQFSESDGRSATMFPSIATGDAAFELATRVPSSDDQAASAFIYPEGTSTEGPARARRGDIPFRRTFSIIEGTVSDADGNPILGAAVTAINSNGEIVAVAYSGEARSRTTDNTSGATLAVDVANGNFRIPVPVGDTYTLSLEALDGPVLPGQVNVDTGAIDGLLPTSFPEETLNVFESGTETFKQATELPITPRRAGRNFMTRPFRSDGNFIINDVEVVENVAGAGIFASLPIILGATTSFQFIEQFPREDIISAIEGGNFVTGIDIGTETATNLGTAFLPSVELMLGTTDAATGAVSLDSTLVLNTPFENIFSQEGDITALNFVIPGLSTVALENALAANPDSDLFVVVSIDDIPSSSDANGTLLPLVRPVITGPEPGTSFLTIDGSAITSTIGMFAVPVNWEIGLRTATPTDAERTLSTALASLR